MTQLRELWIDGFGCLRTGHEAVRFDRERITLFLDENEAGKTTLQMALLASLYGLEDDLRRVDTSVRPHKAHWAPVGGGPFGTRLRVHDGRRLLEVRWDFAKGGDLRVIDVGSNRLVTDEVCPGASGHELGRRLLGVTLEEFLKTFVVRQDDLHRVRDAEGLAELAQRAADTQAGSSTVASAQEAIRGLLRGYPGVMLKGPGLIETEIARLADAVQTLEAQLAQLEADQKALAADDAEFQRVTAEREELRREAVRLDYLAQAAELEELRQQIEEAQRRRAALAALEAEREQLASLRSFPADKAEWLLQSQATRVGLLQNAEKADRAIAELRATALEPAKAELSTLGPLAQVTHEDEDTVHQLLGKTRDFEARERKLLDDIAREETQLAAQGAAIEDFDRLEERFADLKPEDAEFLLDHDRAVARAASEIEEAKRLALEATLRGDRVLAGRTGEQAAGRRLFLTGVAVMASAAVLGGLTILLDYRVAIAVALAGLAAGAWVAAKGRRRAQGAATLQADVLAKAQSEAAEADGRRAALARDQREHGRRLAALAAQFGYEQPEVLVEDYTSLHDLRRQCVALILLRRQEAELAAQREGIEAEVAALCAAWGQPFLPGTGLSRALVALQERMSASLRLRQRLDDLSRKLAEETERRDALRRQADALTAELQALFASAGIPQDQPVEKSISAFNDLAHQYHRFRQLTDELIPQASAGVVDTKTLDTWRADADRLHRAIATMREERPGLVSLVVKERASEYRRQKDEAARREEKLRAVAEDLGHRVLATHARCQAERPRLQDALAQRSEELARARRHRAALELAGQVLDEVGRAVHGLWAEELNRSASALLHRIAPSLSDLKFDNHLSFGLSHRTLPRPVHSTDGGPSLSAGTWDQVCLAVRLCIADFVSRRSNGGVLLLDDPFSRFDDARFEAAMRLLGEHVHGRHQVVLFSCQRQRFQWLRTRDARWFDANVVTRSVSATRAAP
ncbi:MAG TPA: AAA family ATPase [Planctomycetota bacterium]|nr:AAA family ATPase [Planctomycetota bacterium]HRR82342.1 AAA family ATPase [Planctomycetota bacterium]HRT94614.1 AAA family ATPase [Planctomycetota bacterium]